MVFSLPSTEGGYTVQYKIRKNAGIDVVPIEMNALRQAVARLQAGGTVITMAVWPVPESKYEPSFLGRPSAAPVHYVYLALKARVPVVEIVMLRQMNGKYHFLVSEPLTMQEYRDKHEGLIRNTEMVLKVAAEFLHQAPQQWAMSRPVWPELMGQVP
jgi:lauroyl/myristoyl acyltransferase